MLKRSMVRTPICIVISLLLLVDVAIFAPAPAQALDKKSALIGAGAGALAGAGVVLAAPAIAGAVGAAGGVVGIGTAIAGGIAAAGGAVIGVAGAVGGAIAAGVGAVAGFIAGIIASPLLIPALIIIAAVAVGYFLYRRHRENRARDGSQEVFPGSGQIMVTHGDYDMNPVLPPMHQVGPVTIGDQGAIVIEGDAVTISDTPPVSVSVPQVPATVVTTPSAEPVTVSVPSNQTIKDAHDRYLAAYQKYTSLVTTGGSGDVRQALAEYQASYRAYMQLKAQQGK